MREGGFSTWEVTSRKRAGKEEGNGDKRFARKEGSFKAKAPMD